MRVRSFYLDIQQWALEDQSWVSWAVPSPVCRNDTQGDVWAITQLRDRPHADASRWVPGDSLVSDASPWLGNPESQ
jgi:hypothetical protein